MNHEIDPTPGQFPEPPINQEGGAPGPISDGLPPAPLTRSWFARYRRLLIPAAGLAVVGAAAAAALVLVLTPRTSVEKMVPATVDVYAVANLDPSASQKLNLLRAVHRFPDTSTDQKLAEQLDKALKRSAPGRRARNTPGTTRPTAASRSPSARRRHRRSRAPVVSRLGRTRSWTMSSSSRARMP